MNDKINQDKLSGLYRLLLLVLIIWGISAFIIPLIYPKLSDRALLGDSFGVINSLFSGLAFAGIIYTILLGIVRAVCGFYEDLYIFCLYMVTRHHISMIQNHLNFLRNLLLDPIHLVYKCNPR